MEKNETETKKRSLNRFLVHSMLRVIVVCSCTLSFVLVRFFPCFPYFVVAFLLFYTHWRASFLLTNFLLHMQLTSDFAVKMKNNSRFASEWANTEKCSEFASFPLWANNVRKKIYSVASFDCSGRVHAYTILYAIRLSSWTKASHHHHRHRRHQRNNKMKHDKNKKKYSIYPYVCTQRRLNYFKHVGGEECACMCVLCVYECLEHWM